MTYRSVATWSVACAAIGTGAWLVFGNGLVASPVAQDALGPPLLQPQMIVANSGVVALTLEAAPSVITVQDRTFTSNVYNGQYTPPVFRLRRGDELQLRLVNRIGPADVQIDETQATNSGHQIGTMR